VKKNWTFVPGAQLRAALRPGEDDGTAKSDAGGKAHRRWKHRRATGRQRHG